MMKPKRNIRKNNLQIHVRILLLRIDNKLGRFLTHLFPNINFEEVEGNQ